MGHDQSQSAYGWSDGRLILCWILEDLLWSICNRDCGFRNLKRDPHLPVTLIPQNRSADSA
jgi:hypothetical protein